MARRLDEPNRYGGTTDHSEEIAELRAMAAEAEERESFVMINLAADLLEAHDQTGISLDDWPYARQFVEQILTEPILPNGV